MPNLVAISAAKLYVAMLLPKISISAFSEAADANRIALILGHLLRHQLRYHRVEARISGILRIAPVLLPI